MILSKLPTNIHNFMISEHEYFQIQTEDLPLQFVYSCYDLNIIFISKEKTIAFGYEDAGSFCFSLQQIIPKLLNNQLAIPTILQNKLGIMCNEYFMSLATDNSCMNYLLFSNSHRQERPYYSSWLYNDMRGNIIFEITPQYPWNDEDENDRNHPDFISYAEFIKNYQPTIIRTIDPKYLQQWLNQVNILLPIFEENELKDLHQDEH